MNPTWYKIANHFDDINFSAEGIASIEIGEKTVCLVSFRGEFFGCQSACPHAGGELSRGYIDALGNIVCPVHRYKFDIRNGRNTSGEGYHLKRYPVEVRNDGIYLAIDEVVI